MTGEKYAAISPELVTRLAQKELAKGRTIKEIIKAVRSKLHQIGGAYQEKPIDYAQLSRALGALTSDRYDGEFQAYCRSVLTRHASTNERLAIIESYYEILQPILPVQSILDLACGLNPMTLPWMPVPGSVPYYAYDIYTDMIDYINTYFAHIGQAGQARLCDLVEMIPSQPCHLALLLKTIPCLEQIDKSVGPRLLNGINAEYLLVSFPAKSLGGHSKGMAKTYDTHFNEMLNASPWRVLQKILFSNELLILLKHG